MDKRSMVVAGEPVRVTSNGRRYFSKAYREAVIAKCLAPGASLAAVALANGLNANLVRKWVRRGQARNAVTTKAAKLLPVMIEGGGEGAVPPRAVRENPARERACDAVLFECIEIDLPEVRVRLKGALDAQALRWVLEVLAKR